MMSHGYDHKQNQGSVKNPLYQTSTFVFDSAEHGKAYFEVAYGLREPNPGEELGMIYSRLNNPNLDVVEKRLALWDKADGAAVFESGMAAISTVMLEYLKPGSLLLYGAPTYGGTHHFIHHVLPQFGIEAVEFDSKSTKEEIIKMVEDSGRAHKLGLVYIETPANPTNSLFDIEMCMEIRDHFKSESNDVLLAVDNTFMGPLWQKPLELGADLAVYSATKYLGGHSDIVAGVVMGNADNVMRVKVLRTFLGNMMSPNTAWLLTRSLETLSIRMEKQGQNAEKIADYLNNNPNVEKVYYLGNLSPEDAKQYDIYKKQCLGKGAMISFDIKGGEKEAFQFLNNLSLFSLAVSLGSTESLAEHPATMTHVDIPEVDKINMNISPKLVRLSIGVENPNDLIADIEEAFAKVEFEDLIPV